jgi:4-aminobutyrate--pyruvate transaminase
VRGYHGVTVAAASLTGLAANHRDFDLPLDGMLHTDCPHHYRCAHPGESEEAFASRLATNLEALILAEGPETVAAMFAEPVMGAGGVIVPPKDYFAKIQQVLKRYDVLLVADEVICGFGRTGDDWGSRTFALEPDILTCAKALSSGYVPISAVMISEPIWQAMVAESDKIGMFGHGFTYSGHPVAAAVALETLKFMTRSISSATCARLPRCCRTGFVALPIIPWWERCVVSASSRRSRSSRTRARRSNLIPPS